MTLTGDGEATWDAEPSNADPTGRTSCDDTISLDGRLCVAKAGRHRASRRRPGPLPAGRLRGRLNFGEVGHSVVQTVGYNIAFSGAGSLGGLLIARVTGPAVRGEYTAVTSWYSFATLLGELGLPVAVCFYVAKDSRRAPGYVGTARNMMLVTCVVMMLGGLGLAHVLGHGQRSLTVAYSIAFLSLPVTCCGDCLTFALMGRSISLWNRARVSQPLVALAALVVLWRVDMLTLDAALLVLLGSVAVQLGCSHWACRSTQLVPARMAGELMRPLAGYGFSQVAAVAPQAINAYMDQLVLSVAVPPADLGRYSIAVAITLLPLPFVSAIGYVLLPFIAAGKADPARTPELHRRALLLSLGLSSAILLPLALGAPWLIPRFFGPAYRGSVPLVWILTPGGIFLACSQTVANILRGLNRQMVTARAEGIALVFTAVLLACLLPVMGVTGAAVASTIPYGISLGLMLRQFRHNPGKPSKERDERSGP